MRQITIGLSCINTTVGAFRSNTDKVIRVAQKLVREATIISFQEQVLGGYPSEDLIQWRGFVDAQWEELQRLAKETAHLAAVLTVGLTVRKNGSLFNCVAVVCRGQIIGIVPKEKLPTYGVFYEMRTFSPGIAGMVAEVNGVPFGDLIFKFPFGTMAVEVCEDIWSPDGPMRRRSYSGAELTINASSSPWRAGVLNTRREMIKTRAGDNQTALVYVNQFGGQDSLVFDGGGLVCQNGRMLLEAPRWCEGTSLIQLDLDTTVRLRTENTTWRTDQHEFLCNNDPVQTIDVIDGPSAHTADSELHQTGMRVNFFLPPARTPISPRDELFEDFLAAMELGLGDYFEKVGFERIGIALSGGKDSILSLIVAWRYAQSKFGNLAESERIEKIADFIHCFSMPSRYNSEKTQSISRDICKLLGVSLQEIAIEEAYEREVEAAKTMLGPGKELTPITLQNIQARIRGSRMWNWVNSAKALWIQTGNMSEKAVGYTTIGGDMMGGYSLIGNLPKTVIIDLLGFLHQKYGWEVLERLANTKASAELASNQEDERDLMPFPILDACIYLFVGEKLMPSEVYRVLRTMWSDTQIQEMSEIYKPGMLKVWVLQFVRLFVRSIFKWVQSPQNVHLGSLELDRERALQLPVVQSKEWLEQDLAKLEQLAD